MIARVLGYQGIPTTRTVREAEHVLVGQAEALTDEVRATAETLGWDVVENQYVPDGKLVAIDRAATNPWWTPQRTVVDPIYVVPQMLPCPNLGCDDGRVWYGSGDNDGAEPCETCRGSGMVAPPWPDYITTWQVNVGVREPHLADMAEWRADDGSIPDLAALAAERSGSARQVVAYKVTAIDEHSVVGAEPHWRSVEGAPYDWPWLTDPALQNLTAGQVVWRLHLEALDQPYTAVLWWRHGRGYDDPERVPLSVPVGEVTELELTR